MILIILLIIFLNHFKYSNVRAYRTGSKLPVQMAGDLAYVQIQDLAPSEVLGFGRPCRERGGGDGVRGSEDVANKPCM